MSLKDKLKKIAEQDHIPEIDWIRVRDRWLEQVEDLHKEIKHLVL